MPAVCSQATCAGGLRNERSSLRSSGHQVRAQSNGESAAFRLNLTKQPHKTWPESFLSPAGVADLFNSLHLLSVHEINSTTE